MLGGVAFWLGLALLAGAILYALLCKLDPLDDALSDRPHGDWPALPQDFKVSRFHDAPIITGRQ
jgi:hypothetical protein